MQCTLTVSRLPQPCTTLRAQLSARRTISRAGRLMARAEQKADGEDLGVVQEERAALKQLGDEPASVSSSSPSTSAAQQQQFSLISQQQEVINGRAAMTGFVIAAMTELITRQSVWSQIAGKYINRELVEAPLGASWFFFAFVVVALTFASFAPTVFRGEGPKSRSSGPFTPGAELLNGRLAMLGFVALLITEYLRGNNPVF